MLPAFYVERVRKDLGPLWEWLPEGALDARSARLPEGPAGRRSRGRGAGRRRLTGP